ADPFTWVLAVLGSRTFWNPSQGVVVMLVAAIPLASLGGWIWAAQLTESRAGRALLAIAWAFSPVLLGSLAAGRLPTLILAVVLPWLLLAATRCRESWSWSGITSLLAAIALACAPVLMPAAIVLWLIGFAGSGRGIARHVSTVIAPLVLFAPNLLALLAVASPLSLLRDPGITDAFVAGSPWHLLLGFPEFGLEGWGAIVAGVGLGAAPATLLVGVLLLPIVLLAAVGLITGKVHFTLLHAVLGGLGLLTAVGSAQLQLSTEGTTAVSVWTGSGLALYWIAVLGLATVGTTVLRKAAAPIVAVGLVAALVVVSPLIVKLATASTEIAPGETQMPAIVQAAGAQDATLRTLVLTSLDETSVRAELLTGEGLRLDQVRTAAHVAEVTEQDEWVAQLVGMLAGTGGGDDIEAALIEHHVGFVLLRSDGDASARSNLQTAFDEHAVLQSAGQTDHGLLWRSAAVTVSEPESQQSLGEWFVGLGSGAFARMLWLAQAIVLGAMVLLALPTGEVVERPAQRRRRDGGASAAPATPVADSMAPVDGDGELVGAGAPGAPALGGEPVITTAVPEVAVAAEGAEVEAHEAEAEAHVAEAEQQSYGATASLAYPMDPAASMPPVVEFDDGDPPHPDAERPNEGGER
ncbi:MAG: glycosyl transferase, partial [Microbacteriaceae bacterium]|nr:glycosyl transferase [Microbacteriaceae bacterium]